MICGLSGQVWGQVSHSTLGIMMIQLQHGQSEVEEEKEEVVRRKRKQRRIIRRRWRWWSVPGEQMKFSGERRHWMEVTHNLGREC